MRKMLKLSANRKQLRSKEQKERHNRKTIGTIKRFAMYVTDVATYNPTLATIFQKRVQGTV